MPAPARPKWVRLLIDGEWNTVENSSYWPIYERKLDGGYRQSVFHSDWPIGWNYQDTDGNSGYGSLDEMLLLAEEYVE